MLAFPRAGNAGIIDFIYEMSGPQLVGAILLHCKVYFDGGGSTCKVLDNPWEWNRRITVRAFGPLEPRLAVEAIIYTSTGKNSDGDNYKAGANHMVALEPMLEIGSFRFNGLRLYHGAGLSLDRLFGSFDNFGKIGFKLRAAGININNIVDVALNFRWYPDGFTRDEFGFAPRVMNINRPSELTWGFSIGRAW